LDFLKFWIFIEYIKDFLLAHYYEAIYEYTIRLLPMNTKYEQLLYLHDIQYDDHPCLI